ncbi:TPA: DUF1566 domain-containing protein [Legionella pneumophila]
MKQQLLLTTGLWLLFCSQALQASPASTDYVKKHIDEAVSTLELRIQQETKTVETRINDRLVHEPGETYQGGIVFWVDESKTHGLVVAKADADAGQGLSWQNGESGDKTTNARANGILAGQSNTQLIISEQTIDDQEGRFAALAAKNFSVTADGITPCDGSQACYGNWYLPSLNELQLLRAYLEHHDQDKVSGDYWSSTENSVSNAWLVHFSDGSAEITDKTRLALVRPIHSF